MIKRPDELRPGDVVTHVNGEYVRRFTVSCTVPPSDNRLRSTWIVRRKPDGYVELNLYSVDTVDVES